MTVKKPYGQGDATYIAMGSSHGIRELIDTFYDTMESNASFQVIWHMHTEDRETMRDKLALFLCLWTGGPKIYIEKYGRISIPSAHGHLPVTEVERDQWLECMHIALTKTGYPSDLIKYLMIQLARPAESIRLYCRAKIQ